jgi:PEP-CTERM motif
MRHNFKALFCLPVASVALLMILGVHQARAGVLTGLGQAGNYAVLGLDTVSLGTDINASNVTVTGNVGVSHLSTLQVMAPSTIIGNVYYQDAGSVTGPGTVTGSLIQQSMTQAVLDALNANTQNAMLAPNTTINGDVTSAKTFTGSGGLNVIDINGNINLNNANITLVGTPSDVFVINVTGDLDLVGTASLLTSGVPNANVLYNFTGGDVSNPGKMTFNTHVGDVVDGTMLAPYYTMNLDGTWNGELIGGPLNIGLLSNATVNQDSFNPPPSSPPPGVPEPSSMFLFLLGGTAVGCFARRRLRQRKIALA